MSGRDIEVAPGLTKETLNMRLLRGWSMERAMTEPVRKWTQTVDQRFASKCKVLENGCVEWTAAKDDKGYGRFCDEHGQMQLAHRWFFQREHKVVLPVEIDVCHTCDWPPCVCLDHLFSGTRQENVDDCVRKGRTSHEPRAQGEKHGMAKLNADQVRTIRSLYPGMTLQRIATEYDVSIPTIHRIVTHSIWKHIA